MKRKNKIKKEIGKIIFNKEGQMKLSFLILIMLIILLPVMVSQSNYTNLDDSLITGEAIQGPIVENASTELNITINDSEDIIGEINISEELNDTEEETEENLKELEKIPEEIELNPPLDFYSQGEDPLGYELLDGDTILHIWNENYDFYFDYPDMVQLTNNYEEYWSHNTLCLAYKTTSWNYRCTDTLPFNWSITSDGTSYVKIQGNKELEVGNKEAQFNVIYLLENYDEELTINVGLENTGESNITNEIRFAWIIDDINISYTKEDDVLYLWEDETTYDEYYLNESLDISDSDVYNKKLEIHDLNTQEYLRLRWDYNDYVVKVKSEEGQYNAPTTLLLKYDNGIDVGESKSTQFYWIDAIECYAMWGDNYDPAGNYDSYTQFSDGNRSWGMTCHIDPSSTACSSYQDPDACVDGDWDTGYLGCRIQVRYNNSNTWITVASSAVGENCNNDDGLGNHFAELTQSMMEGEGDLRHNNKTDYRCQVFERKNAVAFPEDRCDYANAAIDLKNDYWLNNNTPIVSNPFIYGNITDDEDFYGNYTFTDLDGDFENLDLTQYQWYVDGVYNSNYDNLSIIYAENTTVGEKWSFRVKAFDDVFVTENEEWSEISNNATILEAANETSGREAIEEGINNTIENTIVYTDQQIYTVNLSGSHTIGSFDKVARLDNQTWAFNYITGNETATNVDNLRYIVNIWEKSGMFYQEIIDDVTNFINSSLM